MNSIADANLITSYAREAYAYDSQGRVATQWLDGGGRVYTFQYAMNTSSSYVDGYNNWKYQTQETLTDPDGAVHVKVVYLNFMGTLLLSQLTAGGNTWYQYKAYNAAGQVTLDAQPSALTGFTISGGLTVVPQYAAGRRPGAVLPVLYAERRHQQSAGPASPGAVLGYLAYEQVQQGGNTGTLTNLRQFQYMVRSGTGNHPHALPRGQRDGIRRQPDPDHHLQLQLV